MQASETSETALEIFKSIEDIQFGFIFLIVIAAWVLIRAIQWAIPQIAERLPGRVRLVLLPIVPLLRVTVMVVALVQIVSLVLKSTPENFLALAGAGGLAIGFAFKDYVSSLVAGIFNLYERSCRPGDWIEIDGDFGEVKSLGLRAIEIYTPDDTTVYIPNLKLWDDNVHNNNSGETTHLCVAHFYLHPRHDAGLVRHKLLKVAQTSPYVSLDRRVAVVIFEKTWGTHYKVKAYPIDGRMQFDFITDLTIRGKAALAKLGVEFATVPQSVS